MQKNEEVEIRARKKVYILKFSILPRRDSSKYITTIHIICQVIFNTLKNLIHVFV